MINIDQNKFYRIQNQVSGMYLLAGSWGKSTSDKLVWQFTLNQENTNPSYDLDGFLWQIVPGGNGYFTIKNKVSGFQLLAGSWGKVSTDKAVWQYALTDNNTNSKYDPDGFLWSIDDQGNIINKVSRMYLLAGSWGENPSDNRVWQYALNDGLPNNSFNANGFHWSLVPTVTIYVSRNGDSKNLKLSDSEGHNPGNDDLETTVDPGDIVQWKLNTNSGLTSLNGIAKTVPGDRSYDDKSIDLLTEITLTSPYSATVLSVSPGKDKYEKYKIGFKVPGDDTVYWDDPKLIMKS